MKKKKRINEELIHRELEKLFSEIMDDIASPRIRILSDEEKNAMSKDALNYLLTLRKERYLSEENFEKIMFLATVISTVTGQQGDFRIVEDVLNMVFLTDGAEGIIPEIIDSMMSEVWEYFKEEQIN